MAFRRGVADASRHAHMHAAIIGVKHAADGMQLLERSVLYCRFAIAGHDANANRPRTIQLAVWAAAHLPEAFLALCHDTIVRASQAAIRAESHERGEHQRRRIARACMKIEPQHGRLPEAGDVSSAPTLCLVHSHRATIVVLAVEALHGSACIVAAHLDEAISLVDSRLTIVHQRECLHYSISGEQGSYGVLVGGEGQISYVDPGHGIFLRE